MKTIRQWFEEYPDVEIRNKLLKNLDHHMSKGISIDYKVHYNYFRGALLHGFSWKNTPEGFHFWDRLWKRSPQYTLPDEYPT